MNNQPVIALVYFQAKPGVKKADAKTSELI